MKRSGWRWYLRPAEGGMVYIFRYESFRSITKHAQSTFTKERPPQFKQMTHHHHHSSWCCCKPLPQTRKQPTSHHITAASKRTAAAAASRYPSKKQKKTGNVPPPLKKRLLRRGHRFKEGTRAAAVLEPKFYDKRKKTLRARVCVCAVHVYVCALVLLRCVRVCVCAERKAFGPGEWRERKKKQ